MPSAPAAKTTEPAPAAKATPAAAGRPATVYSNVNLREGAGTTYAVVAMIPAGSRINVAGCSGQWCQASWDGKDGYVIATSLTRHSAPQAYRGPQVYGSPAPGYVPPPDYEGPPEYYGPRPYYPRPYYGYYGPRPYWYRPWGYW